VLANIPAALGVRAHKDRGIRPKMAIVMPKLTAASPNIGSVIPSRVLRAGEYSVNTEQARPRKDKGHQHAHDAHQGAWGLSVLLGLGGATPDEQNLDCNGQTG